MDYKRPSKQRANQAYLEQAGLEPGKPYEEESRALNKLFLIICEGLNTEPEYFKGFPVVSKEVVMIEGGKNTKTKLVEYALQVKKEKESRGETRETWCVFDFDVKPDEADTQPKDFNNAITMAIANGMKVAWSNDSFELWFLLHYEELTAALTRHEYYPILKNKWKVAGSKEMKERKFCQNHYERHNNRAGASQTLAIRRARKLHVAYGNSEDYARQTPCTTVYLLVEELNKYLKK